MNRTFNISAKSLILTLVCALALFAGCKDESTGPGTSGEASAAQDKGVSKAVAKEALKPGMVFPDDVLVVSGTPSLEKLLEAVNAGANAVAPGTLPPNLASLALESMKSDLGLTDISWFRTDAPVLLAVVDPKVFDGKNQLVLLPASDTEKALASLKEGAQRDFEGHRAFFEHRFEKVYVDTIDGYLVFTDHTAIFGKHKSFLEGQLGKWKPEHAFSMQVAMDHLLSRYGVEIAQFKEMAKQTLAREAAGTTAPEVQEWQTQMLFSLIESLDTVRLDLAVEGTELRLILNNTAKKGSELAKLVASSQGQSSGLMSTIPSNAWVGMAGIFDVHESTEFDQLNEMSLRTYTNLLELSADEMKLLDPMIKEAAKLTTGDSAVSVYADQKFPMAMHTVAKIADVAAFRAVNKKLLALLVPHVWSRVVAELKKNGTELPPAQVTSVAEMVALAKPFAAPWGIVPTLTSTEADGIHVDAIELVIDWTLLSREMGLAAQDVTTVDMLKAFAGEKIVVALASGTDRYVQAFGPNAIATATALAKGEDPKSRDAITSLAKDQNWTGLVQVRALLDALMFIPDVATRKPLIDTISQDRMLSATARSTGTGLELKLNLPLDVVGQIIGFASAP